MPAISQISIRIRMQEKGLTIDQFARKVGVKRSYIKSIIEGKRDLVNENIISRIAKVLNCSEHLIMKAHSNKAMRKMFGDDDISF